MPNARNMPNHCFFYISNCLLDMGEKIPLKMVTKRVRFSDKTTRIIF